MLGRGEEVAVLRYCRRRGMSSSRFYWVLLLEPEPEPLWRTDLPRFQPPRSQSRRSARLLATTRLRTVCQSLSRRPPRPGTPIGRMTRSINTTTGGSPATSAGRVLCVMPPLSVRLVKTSQFVTAGQQGFGLHSCRACPDEPILGSISHSGVRSCMPCQSRFVCVARGALLVALVAALPGVPWSIAWPSKGGRYLVRGWRYGDLA